MFHLVGTAYGGLGEVDCAAGGSDSDIDASQVEITASGKIIYHKFPGKAMLDQGWNCRIAPPNGACEEIGDWSPQHTITWDKPRHADPAWSEEFATVYSARESWLGSLQFWPNGKPRIPIPMLAPAHAERLPRGRGVLWEWGEQHAIDSLITREAPDWPQNARRNRTQLQVVVIVRRDSGSFACPGGMLPRHHPIGPVGQAKTEFLEEAGGKLSPAQRRELDDIMEQQHCCLGTFLSNDPRCTAEAWIATKVLHWHLPRSLGDRMEVKPLAEEDSVHAFWADFEKGFVYCTPEIHRQYPHLRVGELLPLFASHDKFMKLLRTSPLLPLAPPMPDCDTCLCWLVLGLVLTVCTFRYQGWI
jgi:hypothetical protein